MFNTKCQFITPEHPQEDNNEFKGNINVIINFQLKANNEIHCIFVNKCHGVTRDPDKNGNLHNNLLKNFKVITWQGKIESLYDISQG